MDAQVKKVGEFPASPDTPIIVISALLDSECGRVFSGKVILKSSTT